VARPPRRSAGIVLHRAGDGGPEVLLVHPGGPLWAKKDDGAWSIPKGEYEPDEDALACALREFEEETGTRLDAAELVDLGAVVQKAGKEVRAWAVRGDLDPATVRSNTFVMEWPPRSGRQQEFPEIDRAEWFGLGTARSKVVKGQVPLLDALEQKLSLR
jgi:predicted NUDIX family NTP pyrophosphohydrolase